MTTATDNEDKGGQLPPPSWNSGSTSGDSFQTWRRKIQIWRMGTNIPGKRQAAQVIQKLSGKAQDLAMEMKDDDLTADDSLTKLLRMLEEKFGSTDLVRSFSAFKELMQLRWDQNVKVEDFLANYDLIYSKAHQQGNGITLSATVQGLFLLWCARLPDTEETLVLTQCSDPVSYDEVRATLLKFYKDKKKPGSGHRQAYVTDGDGQQSMETAAMDFVEMGEHVYQVEDSAQQNDIATDEAGVPDVLWVKGKKFVRLKKTTTYRKGHGRGKGRGHQNSGGKGGKSKDLSKIKCYGCGQLGHYAKDCQDKPKEAHITFSVQH